MEVEAEKREGHSCAFIFWCLPSEIVIMNAMVRSYGLGLYPYILIRGDR
jgi:hypothetical protein